MKTPLILYPGKIKQTLLLICSLAFVVSGLSMVLNGQYLGFLPLIFFGLTGAISIINFIPKAAYLKIDENGIEMCSLYRKSFMPWQAVENFTSGWLLINRTVFFHLKPEVVQQNNLKISKGSFPDTYGNSAKELAELLNNYKQKYS